MPMKRKAATTKKGGQQSAAQDKRLYTLDVFLVGGPLADEFVEQNPVVSRTIEMRADQTLAELHVAIFKAFDREEQHLYEFQVGGRGPQDPKAKRYVLPMAMKETFGGTKPAGDVTQTRLGAIQPEAPAGTYPRVTKRVGASPPQYDDWDEEEDEDSCR
jgi:hypothetical protein